MGNNEHCYTCKCVDVLCVLAYLFFTSEGVYSSIYCYKIFYKFSITKICVNLDNVERCLFDTLE